MDDLDISTCRKCGDLKVRKQDGYYPDGRNKKFVDLSGAQWSGRACPDCVRRRVKAQVKEKRQKAKDANTGADAQN